MWYNFTTLGATGKNGPVSAEGYKGTLLQEVQVTNGVQEWQAPVTGKYHVEACGASGGGGILPKKGGKGAKVSGAITLLKEQKLAILVEQKGSTQDGDLPGSGGGGTFVYHSPSKFNKIIVNGGGGGGGKKDGLPGNDSPDSSGSDETRGISGDGGKVCRDATYIQILGLGLVIVITGAALKVECFAGHCIAVKGEFLWVKVEKVLRIVMVGLVVKELVIAFPVEEVEIQAVE